MSFKEQIRPFCWAEQDNGNASVVLYAGEYKNEIFETRANEGFLGNGYDWTSLARKFLEEKMSGLMGSIEFDPEADMFCAYSSDKAALEKFACAFKDACEDSSLIKSLFSRVTLD